AKATIALEFSYFVRPGAGLIDLGHDLFTILWSQCRLVVAIPLCLPSSIPPSGYSMDLFHLTKIAVRAVFGVLVLACLFVAVGGQPSRSAGFGEDDRVERSREKGTPYGAIGLLIRTSGQEVEAGTAFLISPCHIMTAYHVAAGKAKLSNDQVSTF